MTTQPKLLWVRYSAYEIVDRYINGRTRSGGTRP